MRCILVVRYLDSVSDGVACCVSGRSARAMSDVMAASQGARDFMRRVFPRTRLQFMRSHMYQGAWVVHVP